MKRVLIIFLLTLSYSAIGQLTYLKDKVVLKGIYQGIDIYVQNPEDADGFGFCITGYTVNGQKSCPDRLGGCSFCIDFWCYDLNKGDTLELVLFHSKGCKPKILNPEVVRPKSTFEIDTIAVKAGKLIWKTKKETGKLFFVIEQFRWNKWIKVAEVEGKGVPELTSYEVDISDRLHSGTNEFRVTQTDYSGKKKRSPSATYDSNKSEIEFKLNKRKFGILEFTDTTLYEIYDAYGNIMVKGYGTTPKIQNLKKGVYYINYDNKNEKFVKR